MTFRLTDCAREQHRTGIENGVSTLSWPKNQQESLLSLTNAKSVF